MDDFLSSVLQAFVKATDKLCNIFSENEKRHENMARENQERFEYLVRENQKHTDWLTEKDQQHVAKLHAQQRHDHMRLGRLTILFGAITAIIAMWMHIESNHVDLRIQKQVKQMDLIKLELQQRYHKESILQDQISELREKIKTYSSLQNQLMPAMAEIREIARFGQEQCKHGQYTGKDGLEYREKLLKAVYHFVAITYPSNLFNGSVNATFNKTVANFISISFNTKLCKTTAKNFHDLRVLQRDANLLIITSIEQLQQKKSKTEKELDLEEKSINKILYKDDQQK